MQCAYLKAHYPVQYMAAVLNSETMDSNNGKRFDQIERYMKESMQMRIKVLPPNVNKSTALFRIVGDSIRVGLSSMKGVGLKAATEIEELSPFRDFENFVESVISAKNVNKSVVEKLIEEGALADFDVHGDQGIEKYHEIKKHVDYMQKHKLQKSSMFDDMSF